MPENDSELIKTIAAFSGAGLGLINLGYNLIKDYSIGCKSNIIKSDIRSTIEGTYYYHIELSIYSRNKDVFIQRIKIMNTKDWLGPYEDNAKELNMIVLYENVDKNILSDDIEKVLNKCQYSSIKNYKIEKGRYANLSLVGSFTSIREMDGYSEVPINNWKIDFQINNKIYILPFKFNITEDSNVGLFNRR